MAWYDLAMNPKVVHGYYSGTPALDHLDLQGMSLHRNGPVLRLSADLTPFPDMPSKRWPVDANTAQIEIALWGIRSLTIEGWATDIRGVFTVEPLGEHHLRFSFHSDATAIHGECMLVRIDRITGYVV
jgi:Immunity protein 50